MGNPQNTAATNAYDTLSGLATQAYGVGIPALQWQMGQLRGAEAGSGLPGYAQQAYAEQRGQLQDVGMRQQEGAREAMAGQAAPAAQGGNLVAKTGTPEAAGAQAADMLWTSKTQEGLAGVEQMMKMFGMSMGMSGQAGNASMQASGNQLQAIGMLPNYNNTWANILGGAQVGAGILGAGQKAGWFSGGGGGAQAGAPAAGGASGFHW